jgi:hypothetical protein
MAKRGSDTDPSKWDTVVRPKGGGHGKAVIWEWVIYPKKGSAMPLKKGTVKGAEHKAYLAALVAEIKLLEGLISAIRPTKRKAK